MSLLTRCPACTTLYRVVPDQLRISEGWVKCGQCGDIFDASQHLIEATIDPDPPGSAEADAPSAADFQPPQNDRNDVLLQAPVDAFEADLSDQTLLDQSPDPVQDLNYGTDAPEQADREEDLPSEAQTAETGLFAAVGSSPENELVLGPESEPLQVRWDDEARTDSACASSPDDGLPGGAQVTFLQGDKRPAFWRKPLVRGAMLFVSFALGMSLLGQWVYLERDRLAAQRPDLKPMLQVFCGFANCQIQPMKRIEALSVDSVGFHQLGKETYRLSFTVKNSYGLPLAFPSVELTLTDSQDLPVYRRVFPSNELGAAGGEIAAGADWSGMVALQVNSEALAQRVLGYRLLVFYP